MARISRKELKKDELVQEVSQTVHYLQAHRERITTGSIVAGVILLAGLGGYLLWDKRTAAASEALAKAQETFHAQVRPAGAPPPLPGDPQKSFSSETERYLAALKEFLPVAQKYSWLKAGKIARFYAGLCQAKVRNYGEAEKELNAAISSGDERVSSLARFALANMKAETGKGAEAEQLYRYLADHPTTSVPKSVAQIALAAQLRLSKPAEAVKIYQDMETSGVSPVLVQMARRQLAELKK